MKELKQKFAKQNTFIDKMMEKSIINSNNLKTLKNLTLQLNEKVLKLAETFEKNDYIKHTAKISKTVDEVRNDKHELKKFWREKFLALETKTKADRNKHDADVKQKSCESETKLFKGLLEDNSHMIE